MHEEGTILGLPSNINTDLDIDEPLSIDQELKEKRDMKKREWEELLEKTTEELWFNDLDICLNFPV